MKVCEGKPKPRGRERRFMYTECLVPTRKTLAPPKHRSLAYLFSTEGLDEENQFLWHAVALELFKVFEVGEG